MTTFAPGQSDAPAPLLLIRADASLQIGSGHVMRCLAFAQHWQRAGGQALFLIHEPPEPIRTRIQETGVAVHALASNAGTPADAQETIHCAKVSNAAWILLDGYQFSTAYQLQIKESGQTFLAVDDFGQTGEHHADFVLDQNLGADPRLYEKRQGTTRLLLGSRFVLLRREFLNWRNWERPFRQPARHVLITLGGADLANGSANALELLAQTGSRDWKVTVVVGPNNPHLEDLHLASAQAPFTVQIVQNARNMPELMAAADLAIAAGGTTAWELAFMGLPSFLIALAENQVPNVRILDQQGAAKNLGRPTEKIWKQTASEILALAHDPAARAEMCGRARALIDGLGCQRVWRHLNQNTLRLREAQPGDCRIIWEWANDPAVRAVSFFPEPIAWENHVEWFQSRLANPQSILWIAASPIGQLIGQVRFDLQQNEALISISLDSARRGRNFGNLLIWTASRELFRRRPEIGRINAWIKVGNETSRRAFEKAGFSPAGDISVRGQPAWLFIASRQNLFDEL